VVKETLTKDMRLIGGIPPWVKMYYERLIDASGKSTIKDIFPNYNLFVYGGVNYSPYKETLIKLVGEDIPSVELFPASEGFFAFQDDQSDPSLLLITDSGIFYEFIPLEEAHNENPTRLSLREVELGKDYALIVTNNAGLWAYDIGDCVRFTSVNPYKIVVSGRLKHYISAFGEHVIGKEVETAMIETCKKFKSTVVEFTVAPQVNPKDGGLPYHEWFVEFENPPTYLDDFRKDLDIAMRKQNIYYDDLITGRILQPIMIRTLEKDTFRNYMKKIGKLGGQNKVPRLANDRKIVDEL
jgi:hypothetical protein